jgi:phage-related baseplate assembly protein
VTLDELTTPLTTDQVREAIYSALAGKGVNTTGWKPGSVVRAIITGVAIVLSAFSRLQVDIAKSGFLELAESDWLVLVARYVYGVEKDLGSFATGNVRLDNTGGGVFSGDAGDLIFAHESSGKTYRNTAAFSIAALQTNVVVPVQAVELGSSSTAAPDTITEWETPLLGVTVTNPTALVGTDAETDPVLRARCLEKTGVLSPNGPRDAYSFLARSAVDADGASIGVTRVRTVADGEGNVTVYVATASGDVEGDAEDPDTDLGAINLAIQSQAEPLAVTATAASATPEVIAVTYELWVRDTSSLTDSQIQAAVGARLATFMSTQPIGGNVIGSDPGRVYVSAIETVIGATLPDAIVRVGVTVPASDVELAITDAPILGTVTVTGIHQISGGVI